MRTHVREYVQNDVYVNNLQANYFQHLGNGFYGQVYGGSSETMFGGAVEALYRPLDSNWAFGLDANDVKQRDWRSAKDMMKFTDYSVKTGHLTAYWTPSFAQDVLVKASVGQYLAGDKGGTLEIANALIAAWWWVAMPRSLMFQKSRSTAKGTSPKACMSRYRLISRLARHAAVRRLAGRR